MNGELNVHPGSVRKIPIGRRSLTGAINLPKFSHSIQHESGLERDFVLTTALDDLVEDIIPQPCSVSFTSSGSRNRKYTPDYLVKYLDNRESLLVEIKYQDELSKKREHLMPAFEAAKEYALQRGWLFTVQTEVEIRTQRLDNAKLLLPLLRTKPDPGISARLIKAHADSASMPISELINRSDLREEIPARVFRTVLGLIVHGVFAIDLEVPLGKDSIIEAGRGASWL